jgi:CheY-like chemotaxis protein/anti-sigma regulatory factor (Ser/Thr protein kinase)
VGEHRNPLALVVDDEEDSRTILSRVAEKQGFRVISASDGAGAIRLQREARPDLILLDVTMPGMSGLDALREIRDVDPHVAVVVVSGAAEPEIGERALELGAVNYVGKPFDLREMRFVLERIRAAIEEEQDVRPALAMLQERRTVLLADNDLKSISAIVTYLGRELRAHYPGYDVPVTEARLALYEALANAIEHGNLEIDYDAKTAALASDGGVRALIEQRAADPRFKDRRVRIQAEYGISNVTWTIRDEGPGFSPSAEERDHRLGDTSALHGRGIILMRHLMDHVAWNPLGNEITLRLDARRRESRA